MKQAPWHLWYEIDASTCATCSYVVRGANKRVFCALNHHTPWGEIPSDLRISRLEEGMEIIPIIQKRILLGMTHPNAEPSCSYHPEITRIEEMQTFEQTLKDWFSKPIDEWPLSVRVLNVLKSENITLQELIDMGEARFRKLPKMGRKCALEVRHFMIHIWVEWKE